MTWYIIRRILLIIPTVAGIMIINFILMQAVPGGPVEEMIGQFKGRGIGSIERIAGSSSDFTTGAAGSQSIGADADITKKYRGAQGLSPELLKRIEEIFGLDKPPLERFLLMMKRYITFDFDKSIFLDKTVIEIIIQKLPVSISLGLWTTLLTYLISIPLGVRKAVRHGSGFDVGTSFVIIVCYAIPAFLFANLLIVLFAGGSLFKIFPLRGIVSDNWEMLSWPSRILDYFWHMALPTAAMVINGFAYLTLFTKNSFLEEIRKQYVITARAKGQKEGKILYGHVFRNAMLIVIAGFPAAFLGIIFTGSLLIEVTFSLDGIGLLSYNAILKRDYPLIFGSLYFFEILGLIMHIVNDLMYRLIDPRIDFATREV
jgi:microcin C transport system permease protein